jgi:hypothetical protein
VYCKAVANDDSLVFWSSPADNRFSISKSPRTPNHNKSLINGDRDVTKRGAVANCGQQRLPGIENVKESNSKHGSSDKEDKLTSRGGSCVFLIVALTVALNV